MCGIAGIKVFNPSVSIHSSQVISLLLGIEHRGKDATGVAIFGREPGQPAIWKKPQSAAQAVVAKGFSEFLAEHLPSAATVLCHTRAWTTGPPSAATNNHPLFANRVAVVHNGIVSNHKAVFAETGYARNGEVDSDIIRAIFDAKGLTPAGCKELGKISGSMAIAAVDASDPGRLLLARSVNPLEIGASQNLLIFASVRAAVYSAFRKQCRYHGIWLAEARPSCAYGGFPADSAWLIGPKEFEWSEKIDVSRVWTSSGAYAGYSSYGGYDSWEGKGAAKTYHPCKRYKRCRTCGTKLKGQDKMYPTCMKCYTPTGE